MTVTPIERIILTGTDSTPGAIRRQVDLRRRVEIDVSHQLHHSTNHGIGSASNLAPAEWAYPLVMLCAL
jgi:hypothetical protein